MPPASAALPPLPAAAVAGVLAPSPVADVSGRGHRRRAFPSSAAAAADTNKVERPRSYSSRRRPPVCRCHPPLSSAAVAGALPLPRYADDVYGSYEAVDVINDNRDQNSKSNPTRATIKQ